MERAALELQVLYTERLDHLEVVVKKTCHALMRDNVVRALQHDDTSARFIGDYMAETLHTAIESEREDHLRRVMAQLATASVTSDGSAFQRQERLVKNMQRQLERREKELRDCRRFMNSSTQDYVDALCKEVDRLQQRKWDEVDELEQTLASLQSVLQEREQQLAISQDTITTLQSKQQRTHARLKEATSEDGMQHGHCVRRIREMEEEIGRCLSDKAEVTLQWEKDLRRMVIQVQNTAVIAGCGGDLHHQQHPNDAPRAVLCLQFEEAMARLERHIILQRDALEERHRQCSEQEARITDLSRRMDTEQARYQEEHAKLCEMEEVFARFQRFTPKSQAIPSASDLAQTFEELQSRSDYAHRQAQSLSERSTVLLKKCRERELVLTEWAKEARHLREVNEELLLQRQSLRSQVASAEEALEQEQVELKKIRACLSEKEVQVLEHTRSVTYDQLQAKCSRLCEENIVLKEREKDLRRELATAEKEKGRGQHTS